MIIPSEHLIPHLQGATLHSTVSKSLILHFLYFYFSVWTHEFYFHLFIILYCPYLFWCSDRPKFSQLELLSWLLSLICSHHFLKHFITLQHNKGYWLILDHTLLSLKSAIFPRNLVTFQQDVVRDQDLGTRKNTTHNTPMHIYIFTHNICTHILNICAHMYAHTHAFRNNEFIPISPAHPHSSFLPHPPFHTWMFLLPQWEPWLPTASTHMLICSSPIVYLK